jgi:hypothetical protein
LRFAGTDVDRDRLVLGARAMAGRLGTIAARGHVAPATPAGPRGVIEHPAARVVVADADPLRIAPGQLLHQRVAQAGQRVVDRVADVAMVDRHATVEGRYELDDLARVEGAIDRVQRAALWRPVLDDRVGDLAEGASDRADASELALAGVGVGVGLRPQSVGALAVDHAAVDEPGQGIAQGRQTLERETIFEVVGVQESEGVLEPNLVGMMPADVQPVNGGLHVDNHFRPVDRLRARGYSSLVTDKTPVTGYTTWKGPIMEALVMFVVLVVGFIALDLGAISFGVDSRDELPDSHLRSVS